MLTSSGKTVSQTSVLTISSWEIWGTKIGLEVGWAEETEKNRERKSESFREATTEKIWCGYRFPRKWKTILSKNSKRKIPGASRLTKKKKKWKLLQPKSKTEKTACWMSQMTLNSQVRVANQSWGTMARSVKVQGQSYEVKWREITQLVCSVGLTISVPLVKPT